METGDVNLPFQCRDQRFRIIEMFASLGAQMVENLPVQQETQIQYPGQEDALEEDIITHSSILAWEIPQTEKPGGLQSMGSQRDRHDLVTKT